MRKLYVILTLLGILTSTALFAQTFNSSTTWTCPAGVTAATIQCWGGGGPGGSARSTNGGSSFASGGGGAGGAYSTSILTVVPTTVYTVTVGAAATAYPGTTDNSVVNGNPSWFSTAATIYAEGGAGGVSRYWTSNSAVAGAGGAASSASTIGSTKFAGGSGGTSSSVSHIGGGGGSSAGTAAVGNAGTAAGAGGTAPTGGAAGGAGGVSFNNVGVGGSAPGAGGGGASAGSNTIYLGGSGAAGRIIITYPTITSLSSTTACVGGTITVTGTNLNSSTAKINGVNATVSSNTATGMVVTVPSTTSGTLVITSAFGTVSYATSITVIASGTLALTSGTASQTVCVNSPIGSISYTYGGTSTSAAVSGLPSGVSGLLAGNILTISGTPTVSGTFAYTVSTSGSSCTNPSLGGTLTVNANSTISLSSAAGTDNQTVCSGLAITNITYALGGGATGAALTGSLPTGITGNYSAGVFTISGTTSALSAGSYSYTVTTSGPCVNVQLSGNIIVSQSGTLASSGGAQSQTICVNTAITSILYTAAGTSTGATFSGSLPPGLSAVTGANSITISGTATGSGTFNYSVQSTGSSCLNPTLSGTITVTPNATLALTSAVGTDAQTKCVNNAITNIVYTIGGSATSAALTGSLPTGVSGSFGSGTFTITGTPTASGIFNYTVTTSGGCSTAALSGTIIVNSNGTISLTSAAATTSQTVCINNAITNISYNVGGSATSASITAGALPAGVTGVFNAGVFTLSGTPTASGSFSYTVGTSGSLCVNPTLSGTITVTANATLSLTSAVGTDAQTKCINNAITNIVYTIGGGAASASLTTGALPTGVTGTFSGTTFTISGTPSVSGTFNYTITTSGGCLITSKSGTIIVNPNATITLTSGSAAESYCSGSAITPVVYTVANATNVTLTGSLPPGVSGAYNSVAKTYTISGTPTASNLYSYTLTTTGSLCTNAAISGSLGSGLTGTVAVGTGGTFTTLTAAVNYANTYGLCGATILSLTNTTYSGSETFPITINSLSGSSSVNTLTIKPASGISPTISGSVAGGAVIKLYGADYIIIDGSNSTGGTSRNLSIANTDPTSTGTSSVIWLSSVASPADGATHNTIENTKFACYDNVDNLGDIVSNGAAYNAAADAPNSFNTINNNQLTRSQVGVFVYGNSSSSDDGWVITNNVFGSTTSSSKLTFAGISIGNAKNWSIDNNSIAGVNVASSDAVAGISVFGANSTGTISNNKISDIKNTYNFFGFFGYGSSGIYLGSTSTASNITVKNNFVFDVASAGSTGRTVDDNGYGIAIDGGGGYNIYANSIQMNTSQSISGYPAAMLITSGVTTSASVNIVNNIFQNTQTQSGERYAIESKAAKAVFGTIDHNDYYTTGTAIGFISSTDESSVAAITTGFGGNAASLNVLANFTSSTDLHLTTDNNCALDNAGATLVSVTTDIDADPRSSTPDIGADEFVSTFTLVITNPASVCSGSTVNLTAAAVTAGSTAGTLSYYTDAAGTITLSNPSAVVVTGIATYYIKDAKGSCSIIKPVVVSATATPAITGGPTPSSQNQCLNATGTPIAVTATGAGLTYQWYSNTTNSNTGGTSLGSGSGAQTASFTPPASSAAGTVYFYVVVSGTCTPAVTSSVATVIIGQNTWTGIVSTDWNNTSNWSCGSLPTAVTETTIPVVVSGNYPVVSATKALSHNLTIAAGASLTVNGTGILSLYGAVSNSGVLDLTSGTLDLAGLNTTIGGSQIAADASGVHKIKNLYIGNTSDITAGATNMVSVADKVIFNGSNITFSTHENLTLLSGASGTASITDMTKDVSGSPISGNTISGNAFVQRYISNNRKWQLLSVNTAVDAANALSKNTMQANWMEGQAPGTSLSTGYGMWITGVGGTASGFDYATTTPTVKYLDASNATGYTGVTNPTAWDLRQKPTYFAFVRGDRGSTGQNAINNKTILRQFGGLIQGSTSTAVPSGTLGTFSSVGNPLPSAIDLTKLSYPNGTGTNNIYIWDPNLTSSYGLGAFQTLSGDVNSGFIIVPGGGSYPPLGSTMNTIESGQGFFIQNTASSGTVDFTESSKTSGATFTNIPFFTSGAEQRISATLTANNGTADVVMDGFMTRFNNGWSRNVDQKDAVKLGNTNESVSDLRGGKKLAVEYRDLPEDYDTVFVNIAQMQYRNYSWKLDLHNLDQPGREVIFVDKFLNTETLLDPTGTTNYNFAVTVPSGSYASDRFLIVFRPANVVAVRSIAITASKQTDGTNLAKWSVENELNIAHYELERSADAVSFAKIETDRPATNNVGGSASYSEIDTRPINGVNFYRVKAISNNGQVQYSAVVKVTGSNKPAYVSVFPNPVANKTIHLVGSDVPAAEYQLRVVSPDGKTIYSGAISISGDSFTKDISLSKTTAAGKYTVVLQSAGADFTIPVTVLD